MPERRSHPTFKTSDKIDFKIIKKLFLVDKIPFYLLKSGDQEIVKLDIVFKAGKIYNNNPLIPEITNELIDKGTRLLSSEKISETFDYYGAYIETELGEHNASISLYTLNKYFKETFKLLFEIIFNAIFPKKEIEIFLKNKFQIFLINRQKTDFVSSEIFMESVFGKSHPYGNIITKKDFDTIDREQILSFYNEFYTPDTMYVMLSGKIKEDHQFVLNELFKQVKLSDKNLPDKNLPVKNFNHLNAEAKKVYHKIENASQSSLRVGKITINKLHPDFLNLTVSTVILGGYFGSRLMTNIREDKGYTYGIYAGNISLLKSGYFLISAESGKDVYKKALKEIYKELKILRTIPVSSEELNRVKRWMFGSIMKLFDGPFSLSETYKSIISYDLNSDYFRRYIEVINTITPEKIIEVSNKYLHEDSMSEVISGA